MKVQQLWRGAVLLCVALALIVPATLVGAQSTGSVGGRVANPDPTNPRSQSIFIYTLDRGEEKQDQLLVVNPSDEVQTVLLGSVDGVVTNTGAYTCRMDAEPIEGSGNWVRFSREQVTIPAKGEEKVDFTVAVPAQADVGEHNSCLTIRVVGDEGEDVGGGVRLRTRQAIRMITTIPGDLRRELAIDGFTASVDGTKQNYSMMVSNDGNVSADVDMNVKLYNLFGQEVVHKDKDGKPIKIGGEYPVVPSESLTQTFSSEHAPLFGGWYKATPSIRFDKRLGAFGTQSTTAEYETITGSSLILFLWPTMLGWCILLVAAILVALLVWRTTGRVKRQRQLRKSSASHTVTKEDTIQSLAKKSKVTWQELAHLNGIKAPYSLEVGQKILLPNTHREHKRSKPSTKKK